MKKFRDIPLFSNLTNEELNIDQKIKIFTSILALFGIIYSKQGQDWQTHKDPAEKGY